MSFLLPENKKIRVLFDEETIAAENLRLANEISQNIGKDVLIIAILKGSFVFAADLIRTLHRVGVAPEVDFMTLSSYGTGTESSGQVQIVRDTSIDLHDRDVLLVDDILETGRTLAFAKDLLTARGAKTVRTCVLLDKPKGRIPGLEADYSGFHCPDYFVVGYGMDVAHSLRELPYIGVIEDE